MAPFVRIACALGLLAACAPMAPRIQRLESLARPARGRVGVAVELLESKESYTYHGDQRFPMQSVYKLPIGMAVLNAVDGGLLSREQRVRVTKGDLVAKPLGSPIRDAHPEGEVELSVDELLRSMMCESDGTASDVLLRLVGGPERVTGYLRKLGVDGVVVTTSEMEMSRSEEVQYRNWATPASMLALLRAVHEGRGLSESSHARLLELMTASRTGPRRLKGLLPSETVVAHKTGTSRTVDGLTRATNDVGIIMLPDGRHLAVAVFVADSSAGEETREGVIAAVAKEAWSWWGARPEYRAPVLPGGAGDVAAGVPVAVTLDDLPFLGGVGPGDTLMAATQRVVTTLKSHGVPATGFVACGRKRGDLDLLRLWHAAGLGLGNHSSAHRPIDELTDSEWREDLLACSRQLASVLGKPPTLYRFPMLRSGGTPERRDAAAAELTRLGLRPSPVTIDTSDWVLSRAYTRALDSGDDGLAKEIGAAYVTHVRAAFAHYREVAWQRLKRQPRHILLLHHHALAADYLGPLLGALRQDGASFIALEDALADPVYAQKDDYAGRIGMSWLYRIAPADEAASAWDTGQTRALASRFGVQDEALRSGRANRIDVGLSARILAPSALVIVDERPYPANILLVEMGEGTLVLVSTPYTPAATRRLLTWIEARFGRRRIVAVNPHFHYDSAGGNAALKEAGIAVYGSTRTVQLLEERGEAVRALMQGFVADDPALAAELDFVPPPPDHLFELDAGIVLHFGGDTVQVAFPGAGHSRDGVVAFFSKEKILFGGCMIIARETVGNTSDADLEAWPRSVGHLRKYGAAFVVPGHGELFTPELIDHTLKVLADAGS